MLSILIPWKESDARRSEILEWNLDRYKHSLEGGSNINFEIIFGHDDTEPFNRSRARNNAFKKSKGGIVLFADADTCTTNIYDISNLYNKLMLSSSFMWFICYNKYYSLIKSKTDCLLDNSPLDTITVQNKDYEYCFQSWAGLVMMSSQTFRASGGYDERFRGWGYEDSAFFLTMVSMRGLPYRPKNDAFHLWHDRPPESVGFDQPQIKYNENLFKEYKKAGQNSTSMVSYLQRRGSLI